MGRVSSSQDFEFTGWKSRRWGGNSGLSGSWRVTTTSSSCGGVLLVIRVAATQTDAPCPSTSTDAIQSSTSSCLFCSNSKKRRETKERERQLRNFWHLSSTEDVHTISDATSHMCLRLTPIPYQSHSQVPCDYQFFFVVFFLLLLMGMSTSLQVVNKQLTK